MAFDNDLAVDISREIFEEMADASSKFPPFNSGHEGFAVLKEEVDELWEAVKLNQKRHPERDELMRKECIQVGAMALRFLHDMRLRQERGCP
jgi:NTP pyrophosphatase (non-canonical NTP hydrolase)